MHKINRIVFVWNADFSIAGGVNAVKEVVSGQHTCTLCDIAYHRIMQTSEWSSYKKELANRLHAKIRQPCRNQLDELELVAAAGDYPTVLAHTDKGIIKLLSGGDIDGCDGQFGVFKSKLDAAVNDLLGSSG